MTPSSAKGQKRVLSQKQLSLNNEPYTKRGIEPAEIHVLVVH